MTELTELMRVTSICQCINILDKYELESAINEKKVHGILDKYTAKTVSESLKIQTKLSAEDVPYKEEEAMPAGIRNKWCK